MPRQLIAFYPGRRFPAVSVTGTMCELQCDHCRGHYLKGMKPVASPQDLKELALRLNEDGGRGLLLSGGCDKGGRIPLVPYADTIAWIKQNTNLIINAHTGFLSKAEAVRLVEAGVDCFSIDVMQDKRVIREVLHLEAGLGSYRSTLSALKEAGSRRLVPHICVGLSSKEGEEAALELISEFNVSSLIILVHIPTKGTPQEKKGPPSNVRVERFAEKAMEKLRRPIILGCMRPRGNWRLEVECIELGISGIALPSPNTIQWAKENGMEVIKEEDCCAFYL